MPPPVSPELVRSRLAYDPETGLFIWIAAKRGIRVGAMAGTLRPNGYVQIALNGGYYRAHRLAWAYVHGVWPPEIDHINGDRADNRLCNLRVATRSQNRANSTIAGRNPCGIKGVRLSGERWQARIGVGGRQIYLGTYPTKEAAREAYRVAAEEHFGEFARA